MSATPLSTGGLQNGAPTDPRQEPHALLDGAQWRRSTRSTGMNNCVEAAVLGGGLLAVRDSKRVSGPALLFTGGAWGGFLDSLGSPGSPCSRRSPEESA
jgi:hypothetical protein